MTKHLLNIAFDDKDAVKAAHAVRWDNAGRRWYAEDAAVAAAAQAMADELAGARYFVRQEAAATERATADALAADERKASAALATVNIEKARAALHASGGIVTLAQIARASELLSRRIRAKLLVAEDEHEFRRLVHPLADALRFESNTRSKSFDAKAVRSALTAALQVLKA